MTRLRLKESYGAREVAALTGLTARQLQWWDARRVMRPAVPPRRTEAGGFTERRYTPVDLLELLVLADLRRHGFSVHRLRLLLDSLGRHFGVRLYDTIGDGGPITLLTDGRDVYLRTAGGEVYNLLRAPTQPLLVVGDTTLHELRAKVQRKKKKKKKKKKKP